MGRPDQNDPNAGRRYTESAYINVKDVLGPSHDSGDIDSWGSSHGSDQDCGKESTGWKVWQVMVDKHGVESGWEMP